MSIDDFQHRGNDDEARSLYVHRDKASEKIEDNQRGLLFQEGERHRQEMFD